MGWIASSIDLVRQAQEQWPDLVIEVKIYPQSAWVLLRSPHLERQHYQTGTGRHAIVTAITRAIAVAETIEK